MGLVCMILLCHGYNCNIKKKHIKMCPRTIKNKGKSECLVCRSVGRYAVWFCYIDVRHKFVINRHKICTKSAINLCHSC